MSKKKVAIAAAGLVLVVGAVATVAAQGHRRHHGGEMGGYAGFGEHMGGFHGGGWGGRGALSKSDFEGRTRERFARFDKNSDGVLDAAEIEAVFAERMSQRHERMGHGQGAGRMGERMLRRYDENKDGKVTKEEYLNGVRKAFAEMDLNNDGRITDDDLPPMMRGRNALSGGIGPGFGGGRHGRGMMGGGLMGMIHEADANRDGVVTLDEVLAVADKRFATFDRNKDGTLDTADREAMRKEMVEYRVKRFIHHHGGDKDNRVTREQFTAKANERFARMDFDNNGTIDRSEMPGRGRGHGHGYGRGHHGYGDGEHRGHGRGHGGMMGPGGMMGGERPGPAPTPEKK